MRVVVLAPMPLELDAIVAAFGLDGLRGRVGDCDVTAVHIGMGPPATRAAVSRLLDESEPDHVHVDHIIIAGICGGLDRDVAVGTLVNPEVVVDHTSGIAYAHYPPGDAPRAGKLITTEGVSLDPDLTQRFFADGFVAVDMETAAVAEVCEARGCAWSVYRCISDRPFDGLLDERVVAATNPDGSGNRSEIERLIREDPSLVDRLAQLARDCAEAARLAAEAAVRGCLALDLR